MPIAPPRRTFQFRIDVKDETLFAAAAHAKGLNTSAWARFILLAAAKNELRELGARLASERDITAAVAHISEVKNA